MCSRQTPITGKLFGMSCLVQTMADSLLCSSTESTGCSCEWLSGCIVKDTSMSGCCTLAVRRLLAMVWLGVRRWLAVVLLTVRRCLAVVWLSVPRWLTCMVTGASCPIPVKNVRDKLIEMTPLSSLLSD